MATTNQTHEGRGHDPRSVANELLKIGASNNIPISMMKLMKLVYFSHGWCLGITRQPLCSESAYAGQYCPIFRSLFYTLPYSGSQLVERQITDALGRAILPLNPFTEDQLSIMRRIVDVYGRLGALQLSEIAHERGSPWDSARKTGGNAPISNAELATYFASKIQKPVNPRAQQGATP